MAVGEEMSGPGTRVSAAPAGVPAKPAPDGFLRPVAWLFGRDYIAAFKSMLLYAAYKGKLNPGDWMSAGVLPASGETGDVDAYWRQSVDERAPGADPDAFWFDYISDTGDGQRATYSIAYLCLSDLLAPREPRVGDALASVPRATAPPGDALVLPRGAFLLVGGDTSYHIADYATLANRFQNPFWWAYRDLVQRQAASVLGKQPRLLLGIPGNHDYYDAIDGFNRQFRHPATGENATGGSRPPQLAMPTFRRAQEASYFALRLPHGWWLWGLDSQAGEIDFRQWQFFDDLRSKHPPQRLIVATPEPTTVFGERARADSSLAKTFAALGLERPFLEDGTALPDGTCRLDLSGDIHHYARHWGAPAGSATASTYASVVSGGGGAFLHPTQTAVGEVRPEAIYPPPEVSRRETARALFGFTTIATGGFIWLFGAVIAAIVAFAANVPHSSRDAIDTFPALIRLGLSPPETAQAPDAQLPDGTPRYSWGPNARPAPDGFYRYAMVLGGALVLLGAARAYAAKRFRQEYDPTWSKPHRAVTPAVRWTLLVLVGASAVGLAVGMLGLRMHEAALTRFGCSVIVFVAFAWSVQAIALSGKYSEQLFEAAHVQNLTRWSYLPVWGLVALSVLAVGSSLWFFGRHESAFLIADLLFITVVVLVVGGLTYFAVAVGGGLQRGMGKLAFAALGLSHAVLQLAVVFLLFRKGHLLWATAATLVVVAVSMYAGRALARRENRWLLALAWAAFGAALLAIPFLLDADRWPSVFGSGALNLPSGGWGMLGLILYAGAMGALVSCALFSWYLAVALAFNGHNNEAGGAARIEGFKQFIRFRIDRSGLTGYVIAFDEPCTDGGELRPKVVDIFKVAC